MKTRMPERAAVEAGRLPMRRRDALRVLAGGLLVAPLAGCGGPGKWHSVDVTGSLPSLSFTMTRATDGRPVTAADYRGQVVMLYFGYTACPDACPTTLSNVADVLGKLGKLQDRVSVLFVTVDPNRDSLATLKDYAAAFSPRMAGLRGTPDQLARLARRYRVVYSVSPATKDHPYEVTHSSALYVFDQTGAARLLVPSMASTTPDITGTAADLRRLVQQGAGGQGVFSRLLAMV